MSHAKWFCRCRLSLNPTLDTRLIQGCAVTLDVSSGGFHPKTPLRGPPRPDPWLSGYFDDGFVCSLIRGSCRIALRHAFICRCLSNCLNPSSGRLACAEAVDEQIDRRSGKFPFTQDHTLAKRPETRRVAGTSHPPHSDRKNLAPLRFRLLRNRGRIHCALYRDGFQQPPQLRRLRFKRRKLVLGDLSQHRRRRREIEIQRAESKIGRYLAARPALDRVIDGPRRDVGKRVIVDIAARLRGRLR